MIRVPAGRTAELSAVRTAYDRATDRGPVTVLISGEAGIGKSLLTASAVADLPGGPTVLTGNCLELGTGSAPYTPFISIVRELETLLGPESAQPGLSGLLTGAGPRTEDQFGRVALLAGLLDLIHAACALRPLVLVVEDLHWADASSRELFAYLVNNLSDCPVLLVGTYRTGELSAGDPGRQVLAELGRRTDVIRLALTPLTEAAVREQLSGLLGRPPESAEARQVHRRSGGNPFFVEALAGGEDRALSLRALLRDRTAALPPLPREVLRWLAVAARPVPDDLLLDVAGLAPDDLGDVLRILTDRQLIVLADGRYAIRHDLLREAAYDDLAPIQQRDRHDRLGTALLRRPDTRPAELAEHWFASGRLEPALRAAWEAAELARRGFAYDEEALLLRRILDHWSEGSEAQLGVTHLAVLEHAILAASATGRAEQGLEYTTVALAALDPIAEPARVATAYVHQGVFRNRLTATGGEDIDKALAVLRPDSDPHLRCWAMATRCIVEVVENRSPDAREWCLDALRLAEELGDEESQGFACLALGCLEDYAGQVDEAVALVRRARAHGLACGNHHVLLTAVQYEAFMLAHSGNHQQAIVLCQTWLTEADRLGRRLAKGSLLAAALVLALLNAGRWDEARELGAERLGELPPRLFTAWLRLPLAAVARVQGDREEVARQLEMLVAEQDVSSETFRPVVGLQALLALDEGDPERADRILDGALPLSRHARWAAPMAVIVGLVQRARRQAAPRDRRIQAETAARIAEVDKGLRDLRPSDPVLRAELLMYRALTQDTTLPDWDLVTKSWRELDRPYDVARSLVLAAETALANSNKPGARVRLLEARELAVQLGAEPLLERVDALGERAGIGQEAPVDAALGLSRRELDVLRVLAKGLSNHQIAAELFISTNTVSSHLASIYTKLGVTTRTEAAAAAYRAGLLG
ncbi:AAA family ATPase [Kribbella sp. NPDC056951]|uniref:helix-turn-helix transcriptional regulator n=1 Tax=Kribbella sp. NPDC056951 TaxID=3345978 RepID=UPI0036299308